MHETVPGRYPGCGGAGGIQQACRPTGRNDRRAVGAEACFSSVAGAGAAGQGVDVELKCDGSGAGRGGPQQKDQLPPLMPGLKGRQQQ